MRLWDAPLDYDQFSKIVRRIESSLSENLIKNLFARLKENDGKVNCEKFIGNICGSEYETIDFKLSMYKDLYTKLFQNGLQN